MSDIVWQDHFEHIFPPRPRSDVTIVIGTFGDPQWCWRGNALRQREEVKHRVKRVLSSHGKTLAVARNDGAKAAQTEWLIFLDADDELAPGYVEAMLAGEGDIRKPATLGFYPDGTEDEAPAIIPERAIAMAKRIVIGAMCRRDLFLEVGGFREWPVLEDWDLWRRMVAAGATVGTVPEAVYRVGVNPDSRNQNSEVHNKTYWKIRRGE